MIIGPTDSAENFSAKMRLFVSSVQDELVNERTAILELVNTDSFLSKHVEAVLFEHQPASTLPAMYPQLLWKFTATGTQPWGGEYPQPIRNQPSGNQQLRSPVKKRFPEDFMFELTKQGLEDWRCKFGTSNGVEWV